MDDLNEKSDYWMIANFPSPIGMPENSIADFRTSIRFDHWSSKSEHLGQSPEYPIFVRGAETIDEAVYEIKKQASDFLTRDFPDAEICL